MTSNVGRLLRRPCALSQRSPSLFPSTTKRHISYQTPQETLTDEEANKILRIADQHALRKTHRAATNFKTSITNLQKAIDIIPTKITNPDIQGEYILGSVREKVQDTPNKAAAVIKAVENVQANLKDLTVQGYGNKKDAKDLVREFQKEIEGWSEEKKREELKNWQLQEEGRIVRLNEASHRLVTFVNEKLRRPKGQAKVPDFNVARGSAVESPVAVEKKDKTKATWPEPESAEIKPLVSVESKPPSQQQKPFDLEAMQKQLEENVVGSSGKKLK